MDTVSTLRGFIVSAVELLEILGINAILSFIQIRTVQGHV